MDKLSQAWDNFTFTVAKCEGTPGWFPTLEWNLRVNNDRARVFTRLDECYSLGNINEIEGALKEALNLLIGHLKAAHKGHTEQYSVCKHIAAPIVKICLGCGERVK